MRSFKRYRFVKDLKDLNFRQLVTEITCPASKTCSDHIWANKPERIVNMRCPNICISDHLPVLAKRLYKHCSPKKGQQHKSFCYRDFKNLDHAEAKRSNDPLDWSALRHAKKQSDNCYTYCQNVRLFNKFIYFKRTSFMNPSENEIVVSSQRSHREKELYRCDISSG